MLKLKNRKEKVPATPAAPTTVFGKLVAEAIKVTNRLNFLAPQVGVSKAGKLTSEALLNETLQRYQIPIARIHTLRKKLDGDGFEHSKGSLRRMIQYLRDPYWSMAPKEARRLNYLSSKESENELLRERSSVVELFAVAVMQAAEKFPEAFGTCDSSALLAEELDELRGRQKELFVKIATAITAEDMDIGPADEQGKSKVSFKVSGGKVPISPADNSGERLIAFLMNQRTN